MTEEQDQVNIRDSRSAEELQAFIESLSIEQTQMVMELARGRLESWEATMSKMPDEMWREIFKHLGLRDLVAVSGTSNRLRALSLETVEKRTDWDNWHVTSKEALRCPESYAIWFSRVPSLNLKIDDILWSSDEDALTVKDIETAQRMVQEGQLTEDFITRKVDSVKNELSYELSYMGPELAILTTGASMAREGLITSLEMLRLLDIDITPIPADDLAALCSVVTDYVWIGNVTGDVSPVLNSLQGRAVMMFSMTLDDDATKALVNAMTQGVEMVYLRHCVSLDISIITQQYDGKGKCSRVYCWEEGDWDNISLWAKSVGWAAAYDYRLGYRYVVRNEKEESSCVQM